MLKHVETHRDSPVGCPRLSPGCESRLVLMGETPENVLSKDDEDDEDDEEEEERRRRSRRRSRRRRRQEQWIHFNLVRRTIS